MGTAPSDAQLIEAIADITGTRVKDRVRLRAALTHASARKGDAADYQRLEFLGDRVLGLAVAEMIFADYPQAPEGELSLRLNALVNAETLAEIADEAGMPDLIRTSGEVRARASRNQVNLRSDVMEALIAVLYLEGGMDAARTFIKRYWEPRSKLAGAARRDAKTALQEWGHQISGASPLYSVDNRSGPDHDPVFTVSVKVGEMPAATAQGRSKREAEQAAAAALLRREKVWKDHADD
ncbi:MAG: ribonuclease III [Mesorhizobium sp.]|nr:ribonuclease III [Mesorhizobium sp.]